MWSVARTQVDGTVVLGALHIECRGHGARESIFVAGFENTDHRALTERRIVDHDLADIVPVDLLHRLLERLAVELEHAVTPRQTALRLYGAHRLNLDSIGGRHH